MTNMARVAQKRRKRERTLGQAIGLALGVTLGVVLLLFVVLMLFPGSALHQMFVLVHYNSSATLRTDPLFQQWMEKIDEQEALLAMPLSLLCGGLILGWSAPHYATCRRVLISAAAIALGLVAVSLAFLWPTAVIQQNLMNSHEGGTQNYVTAPSYVIRNQIFWGVIWALVCMGGAWLGRRLRARSAKRETPGPALKAARR